MRRPIFSFFLLSTVAAAQPTPFSERPIMDAGACWSPVLAVPVANGATFPLLERTLPLDNCPDCRATWGYHKQVFNPVVSLTTTQVIDNPGECIESTEEEGVCEATFLGCKGIWHINIQSAVMFRIYDNGVFKGQFFPNQSPNYKVTISGQCGMASVSRLIQVTDVNDVVLAAVAGSGRCGDCEWHPGG